MWKNLSNGSIGLNSYGLYAYDTVWMIARALEKFFNKGRKFSFSSYSPLAGLKGTKSLNLGGLRGLGSWILVKSLWAIDQSPETLYAKPLNRSSSNQHLRSVVWPGNTTEKPRGWEFSNNNRPLRIGVPLDHV
ncbi:putative periplasmic binding protein-like I [Helianthus annuus]|nr:putative periplasmic binding protein-like I [Helianthus annuus]